jgi:nucleoside-diphosphate-sugar epimerase
MHVDSHPSNGHAHGELVLVPGGAGFVGSHLCDRLRVRGHRVLALDEAVEVARGPGTIALDGEREIERRPDEPVTVRLVRGPLTIDVDAAMRIAAHATPGQPAPG